MKIKINYDQSPLNGIFDYMFAKATNKIHQFVQVSASSTHSGRGDPFTTIDPNANEQAYTDCWVSELVENSNLTISFINHQFALDSYTLQSRKGFDRNVPAESYKLLMISKIGKQFITKNEATNLLEMA